MSVKSNLTYKIRVLQELLARLEEKNDLKDKLFVLNKFPMVATYLEQANPITALLPDLAPEPEYALKSLIAVGQAPTLFPPSLSISEHVTEWIQLLEQLMELELFYRHIGGIIGYHLTVLRLMIDAETPPERASTSLRYLHPKGVRLHAERSRERQAVRWGIESLKKMAVIYPLGGAGDRLNLTDANGGGSLPAACLPFLGRRLLEGLMRDLQALEYLYFKLFGKQIAIPVAIMTSMTKNNHRHILAICQEEKWFGRPSESFHFFIQPLVPMITIEGNWALSGPLTPLLKPCGHGALWKLAEEQEVFAWLASKNRHSCWVRQINNPLAGTDDTVLGLIGIGCRGRKAFGFASCPRIMASEEGTDVLIERKEEGGYSYCLTNVEYTHLAHMGLEKRRRKTNHPFSPYPANTNILFAHIPSIRKLLPLCPIPGQIINMKSRVASTDPEGRTTWIPAARLESTMQNIADLLVDRFPRRLAPNEHASLLHTFIVYNERSKTLSTTKKSYRAGESLNSTPEQAYYDLLSNHYKLLQQCRFELPEWSSVEEYLVEGPSCIFLFHPALGPLYSVIKQKIRKGRFWKGSELQLEIAEVDIEHLSLRGSLLIEAVPPIGSYDARKILRYGRESRCTLKQVAIDNLGVDRPLTEQYWKNDLKRRESIRILLHEESEFHAEGVSLTGAHVFEVPPRHRLTLTPCADGGWSAQQTAISHPSWQWHYGFDARHALRLRKIHPAPPKRRNSAMSSPIDATRPDPSNAEAPTPSSPPRTGSSKGRSYTPHQIIPPSLMGQIQKIRGGERQAPLLDEKFRNERAHFYSQHPDGES